MKLQNFSSYFVIFLLLFGLASCDTTRRASRRIQKILNEHPELTQTDTMRVDTLIPVVIPTDTVTISVDDLNLTDDSDTTFTEIVAKTEHGTFTIQKLPTKAIKISYEPDTIQVRYEAEYLVPHMTLETHDRSWAQDALLIVVALFVCTLFIKTAFSRKE